MNYKTTILATTLLLGAVGAWWFMRDAENQETASDPQVERLSRPNEVEKRASRWSKLTDHRLPRETRLNIARSIERSLSRSETAELFSLLRHQPEPGDASDWWVVMNEIMEQMRKHGAGSSEYTDTLVAILTDPAQAEVTRDYAAQHLAQWLSPAGEHSPGESDPAKRAVGLRAFADTITDETLTHTAIPGTALMALTDAALRLPPAETEPVWEKLDPILGELITGTRSAELSLRVSAIQSAALRRAGSHLPAIRVHATDEKSDPSLRLSSIAALGHFADPADRDTLTTLANSNTKFQYAAKTALMRF